MKFTRFKKKNEEAILQGIVNGNEIKQIEGDMFTDWKETEAVFHLDNVELLVPFAPRHIIGIGANYVAKEEDKPSKLPEIPVFFYKPLSSAIPTGQPIVIPSAINEVKFESELAVVIGKEASNISEEEVTSYIFGYTVANDVTAPQFFREDGHWTIGKSYDTFTPIGPFVETELDPDEAVVEAYLNGDKKQDSPVSLMIVSMRKMISYLSKVMTLQPGDVILTGSPLGAEFMKDGDEIVCEIAGIGKLINPVTQG